MIALVFAVALLALAGFLFWLAERNDALHDIFFAIGAEVGAMYFALLAVGV